LVQGRVLVANNAQDGAYEIAHEALLTSWSTLAGLAAARRGQPGDQERIEQAAGRGSAWPAARSAVGRDKLTEARAIESGGARAHEMRSSTPRSRRSAPGACSGPAARGGW